jgi:hypothetical protein
MATTTQNKSPLDETYNKLANVTPNQEGIKKLDEYKNLVNQKTSALSSLGQANQQAMKYAQNSALAQGYATQGAALQNAGSLQNAYMNQVGGINQQYQQQLGNLQNTASQKAFTNFETEASNVVQNGKSEQEIAQGLNKLVDAYGSQMNSEQLGQAQRYLDNVMRSVEDTKINEQYGFTGNEEGISVDSILSAGGKAKNVLGKGTGDEYKLQRLQDELRAYKPYNGKTFKVKNKYFVYKDGNLIETKVKIAKPDVEI